MTNRYALVEGPFTDNSPTITVLLLKNGSIEGLRSADRRFFGLGKAQAFLDRKGEDRFDFTTALRNPTYYSISEGKLTSQIEKDYRRLYPISSEGQTPDPEGRTKHLREIAERVGVPITE